MAKINEPIKEGWRKLSASPKAKRHFFESHKKESICGGAMMATNIVPEAVADNDSENCTKCQAALKASSSKEVDKTKPTKATEKAAAQVDTKADAKAAKQKAIDDAKAAAEKEKAAKEAKAEKDKAFKEAKEAKEKAAKDAKDTKAKAAEEAKAAKAKAIEDAKAAKLAKIEEAKAAKQKAIEDAKAAKQKKIDDRAEAKRVRDEAREKARAEAKVKNMPTVKVTDFSSIDELIAIAKTLDVAEERPLNAGEDILADHRAIWNKSKNRLAAIVSDDYSLVQHREAVKLVAKGLDALNTPVYGQVKNIEDVVTIEVFFPKLHIKDDAKGIDVGGKIINSYNKSRAFKGFMVAKRKVCENGMYMRKLIPECEFYEIHIGDLAAEIPALIKEFFEHLKETTEAIKAIVDQAMETTIKFKKMDQVEATFASELASPVHAKALIRDGHLDKSWSEENKAAMVMTKWEFVNAITSYVSHSPVVESRIDIYSMWAENILNPEYTIKVVSPVVKPTDLAPAKTK
jgi:chemotaxis protein histidine kinase CheA